MYTMNFESGDKSNLLNTSGIFIARVTKVKSLKCSTQNKKLTSLQRTKQSLQSLQNI